MTRALALASAVAGLAATVAPAAAQAPTGGLPPTLDKITASAGQPAEARAVGDRR